MEEVPTDNNPNKIRYHNSNRKFPFKPLKSPKYALSSTGNEGVPTNKPTNQQTNQQIEKRTLKRFFR